MSEAITASNPWDTQWHQELHHIDELMNHHEVFAAIQYIFTSFFMLIGKFMEDYRMDRQAKIMKALDNIQSLRNEVQEDFQAFNNYKTMSSSEMRQKVADATAKFQTMEQEIQSYAKLGYFGAYGSTKEESFVKGFLGHFFNTQNPDASIFQTTDLSNLGAIVSKWTEAWKDAGSVGNSSSVNPAPGSGLLGIINNQFNEAKTTSQSSVVQSKLNYWSKEETTAKSVVHMGLSSYSSIEKTANNNLGK
ncbi:MAG: hypothetical protein H7A38_06335 [Chlamydiales bacterium]|nr:hypothetical protein [Chlamydiales bacterium]